MQGTRAHEEHSVESLPFISLNARDNSSVWRCCLLLSECEKQQEEPGGLHLTALNKTSETTEAPEEWTTVGAATQSFYLLVSHLGAVGRGI